MRRSRDVEENPRVAKTGTARRTQDHLALSGGGKSAEPEAQCPTEVLPS